MKIKHAVICAAGLGSRLGKNMPKTLVNITEDKRIIDHQLELVKDFEIVSLVVGYKCEGFKNNSTAFSIDLATKDFDEPYVSIDGDL